MHTHAKAKNLSELMDELLEYVPESMSSQTALRQRSVTETIELPMNKLAHICETQLQTYRDALMTRAEESAKTASSFGVFKQAAPGKELDFKRELPIVIACLKYLKSHQEADKTAFLNLYTSVETSANFKKKNGYIFCAGTG